MHETVYYGVTKATVMYEIIQARELVKEKKGDYLIKKKIIQI